MGHAPRTPRCSRPASARTPDRCWPRRPSAAPRRTRRGGGRAAQALAFPSSRPSRRCGSRSHRGWKRRRRWRSRDRQGVLLLRVCLGGRLFLLGGLLFCFFLLFLIFVCCVFIYF